MTHTITKMLETNPAGTTLDQRLLADCIQACLECAQTCTACADACLSEEMVHELRTCIRLNLDCADLCEVTSRVLSRLTSFDPAGARAVLQACAEACRRCGAECAEHAEMHEHCAVCAEACRTCEEACTQLLTSIG